MKVLKIHGGKELEGKVKISGAKNSAVALLPATILCDDTVTLHNVPDISDVDALVDILNYLGAKVDNYEEESYRIDTKQMQNREIIEEMSNSEPSMKIVPVYGEPLLLPNAIAALTGNSLTWDSNNVSYYLASTDLSTEEMLTIAKSLGNTTLVSKEK